MAGLSRQKQKLLTMKQYFEQKTDDEHSITGNKLIDILAQYGIKAERKTIYDDIKTLCDSGMDIEITKDGHSNAYYLGARTFQDEELFVLVDAIASCKFLTKKKSQELIAKIQGLTSEYKAKQLRRDVFVNNRSKAMNESVYYNLNKVQEGIFEKKTISFQYYDYNFNKKKILKHDGEIYTVSPFVTVWEEDNYYLVCYCNKHEKICRYRIDRMANVSVNTGEKRRELTADEKLEVTNCQSVYSMYGGETETVTLEFENHLLSTVIDRFGEKVICHQNSDHSFYINTEVQISPTFWGWLFKFGSEARVIAPENVVELAKKQLESIRQRYE